MNKISYTRLKYVVFFACVFGLSAQAQTLKYTYDALGRVTFVEDATNGNRDYDYDRAGNRTLVAINTANDETVKGEPSVPLAPTGLTVRGPFSQTGDGYNFSWNPVVGATSYEGQLKGGTPFTTAATKTSADSAGPRPDWVRARNDIGAGPIAYFPNATSSSLSPPLSSSGSSSSPPRSSSTSSSSLPPGSSSSSSVNVIPKPTGLSAYRFADCVYKAKWNAVAGATSYEVYDTRGAIQKTANLWVDVACTLGQPESNKPNKVYACANFNCSQPAYFF